MLLVAMAAPSIAATEPNGYRGVQPAQGFTSMLIALTFIVGAVVGSFLNVCIVRVPLRDSIVLPASHCRNCAASLRAFDNIPLLSFLWLRGRCRHCRQAISWRYPLVEFVTATAFVLLVISFPLTPMIAVRAAFLAALIVITFIDLEHQIIPDVISLPAIVIGLGLAALGFGPSLLDSLVGVLLGGGLLYAVAAGYHALTGVDGMGGGDIKLLAMIGAFLGWQAVLLTLLISSLLGSIVGALLIVTRRTDARVPVAFGPFLALGAIISLFYGDALVRWYIGHILLA